LLGLVLHLVRHRADLLVLDPGGGDEHAGHEPDRGRADGEADWVLLGDSSSVLRTLLDVTAVRCRAGDRRLHALYAAGDGLLGPAGHVGLVAERLRRVAHGGTRALYITPDV